MSASSAVPAIIGLTKLASTFVVSSGAGTIVKTATKMVMPVVATGKFATYKKISVALGAAALGGLTADATSKYMHSQIDDYVQIAGFAVGTVADVAEGTVQGLKAAQDVVTRHASEAKEEIKEQTKDESKKDGSSFHKQG